MKALRTIAVVAVALAATVAAFGAPAAWAPVPPKNCGMLREGGLYNIKADQIRCGRARRYARRYLASHDRPRGYSCREYGRETRIEFRCSKGSRVFFAIRR